MTISFHALIVRAGNESGARELFEDVVAHIVRIEHPSVKQVVPNPGDLGIDAFVGDLSGEVSVWQSKFFIQGVRKAQQQQIRSSFASVVKASEIANFRLTHWTLCIPVNLDIPTRSWWDRWKSKQQQKYGVTINLWDLHQLQSLLMKDEAKNIRSAYFFDTSRHHDLLSLDRQGLGIPVDFGASISDFIKEYSQYPFAGRVDQLRELNQWLDESKSCPYRLILAPAGRGKSALLVNWSLGILKRTDLDVIFLPISIRFRTNTATAVLLSLVSRLALLHDGEVPNLLGVPTEVLCDLARRYLQKDRPSGNTTLVVLDGLDEAADKEILRGLLPVKPPSRLRVLLSARPHLGKRAEGLDYDWLSQLGIPLRDSHPRNELIDITWLKPLGAVEVQKAASDYLSGLADLKDVDEVASELFRVSNGEPFVLMLYLQRLEEDANLIIANVASYFKSSESGLQSYFRYWWNSQQILWSGDVAHLDTTLSVMCVLSVTIGPTTVDDIRAIYGSSEISAFSIRRALQSLYRLVIATDGGNRFAIVHEMLREFIREELMSPQEIASYEQRIVAWGISEIEQANRRPSHRIPEYLVRNLTIHTLRCSPGLESIELLLAPTWAIAWYNLEGNFSGFLVSINRVSEFLGTSYVESSEIRREMFLNLIRAILVRGSVISASQSLPAELVSLLRLQDVWTDSQALSYIGTIHDSNKRLAALVALSKVMLVDDVTLDRFTSLSFTLMDSKDIARSLMALILRTPPSLIGRYIEAVKRIRDPVFMAQVIRGIEVWSRNNACELAPSDISTILSIIDKAQSSASKNGQRCWLSLARASFIDPALRRAALEDTLILARSIINEEEILGVGDITKFVIICELAEAFQKYDPVVEEGLRKESLEVLLSFPEPRMAAIIFSSYAKHFAGEIFEESLEYARKIDSNPRMNPTAEAVDSLISCIDLACYPERTEIVERAVGRAIELACAGEGDGDYEIYYRFLGLENHLAGKFLPLWSSSIEHIKTAEWRLKCTLILLRKLKGQEQRERAEALVKECISLQQGSSWKFDVLTEAAGFLDKDRAKELALNILKQAQVIDDGYHIRSFVQSIARSFNTSDFRCLDNESIDIILRGLVQEGGGTSVLGKLEPGHRKRILKLVSENLGRHGTHKIVASLVSHIGDGISLADWLETTSVIPDEAEKVIAYFSLLDLPEGIPESLGLYHSFISVLNSDRGRYVLSCIEDRPSPSKSLFLSDCLDSISSLQIRVDLSSRVLQVLDERGRAKFLLDLREAIDEACASGDTHGGWGNSINRIILRLTHDEITALIGDSQEEASWSWKRYLFMMEVFPGLQNLEQRYGVLEKVIEWFEYSPTDLSSDDNDPFSSGRDRSSQIDNLSILLTTLHERDDLPEWSIKRLIDIALNEGWRGRELLKILAPMLDDQDTSSYVEMAKEVWPPSDRIELLEAILPRLSLPQSQEILEDVFKLANYYYLGGKAVRSFLGICSAVEGSDLRRAVRLALELQLDSSRRMINDLEISEFVEIVEKWVSAGRLSDREWRDFLRSMLDRLGLHDRSNVLSLISGMSKAIDITVGGGILPKVVHLVVGISKEWP